VSLLLHYLRPFVTQPLLRLDKLLGDVVIVGGGILLRIESHLLPATLVKKCKLSLEV
jgi:hypothetical protein